MTAPTETWVFCGGARHRRPPPNSITLEPDAGRPLVRVGTTDITDALTGRMPPQFNDLLRIAAFVLAADGAVKRGSATDVDLGDRWHRSFNFVVGVECPEFWRDETTTAALVKAASFVSGDDYTFEFQPLARREKEQLSLCRSSGAPMEPWDNVGSAVLFSGGMDSLAGAVQALAADNRAVMLVSHRSAPKTNRVQDELVAELRRRWGDARVRHVGINASRHDDAVRDERTQRSRSLLFAAMGGAVANLLNLPGVLLPENGVIAINLPPTNSTKSTQTTHTAHPKALDLFSQLLTRLAGRDLRVTNPLALSTRSEVIGVLQSNSASSLIAKTVSCAYVMRRKKDQPHCGVCSQCIDRRLAVLAAGAGDWDPEDHYEHKIASDAIPKEADRLLAVKFVEHADRLRAVKNAEDFRVDFPVCNRAISGIRSSLGLSDDDAADRVFDLHRRHGVAVSAGLAELARRQFEAVRDGRLPPESLPMLLYAAGRQRRSELDGTAAMGDPLASAEEYIFEPRGDKFVLRFHGGRAFTQDPLVGVSVIWHLIQRAGQRVNIFTIQKLLHPPSEGAPDEGASISVGIDQQALREVRGRIKQLKERLTLMREIPHASEKAAIEEELADLRRYLASATRGRGKLKWDDPRVQRLRLSLRNDVTNAVTSIRKKSEPLAKHLKEEIKMGIDPIYRCTDIKWKTHAETAV